MKSIFINLNDLLSMKSYCPAGKNSIESGFLRLSSFEDFYAQNGEMSKNQHSSNCKKCFSQKMVNSETF